MRIPTYQAGSTPSSEMPGRSFRARMNAQPFIQEALEKGAVAQEAFKQIGAFAQDRYKQALQAQVDEKVIQVEEQLATTANKMADGPSYHNVFDGDKLWETESAKIRENALANVRDVAAKNHLKHRFDQMELSTRFKLQNTIDAKIEAANVASRNRILANGANIIANGTQVGAVNLDLQNIGADSVFRGGLGTGAPDKLAKQEYAMLVDGTFGALNNLAKNSDNAARDLEIIRSSFSSDDLTDLATVNNGLYVMGLLRKLDYNDAAKLIRSVGGDAAYLNKLTAAQQREIDAAKGNASTLQSALDKAQDGVTSGVNQIPATMFPEIEATIAGLDGIVDASELGQLRQSFDDLQFSQNFLADHRELSPPQLAQALAAAEQGGANGVVEAGRETLTVNLLRDLQSKMDQGLSRDRLAYAQEAGNVQLGTINFSDPQTIGMDIQERIEDARRVQSIYFPELMRGDPNKHLVLLTNTEATQLSNMFDAAPLTQKLQMLEAIQGGMAAAGSPDLATNVYSQIGDQNGMMSHAGGLVALGRPDAAREILQGLEQIKAGVAYPKAVANTEAGVKQSIEQVIAGELQEALRFQPEATGAIIQATKAIIANRFIGVSEEDLTVDNVKEAMQIASGAQKRNGQVYGGIHVINEAATFIPSDKTVDEFEYVLDSLTPEMFSEMGFDISPAMWDQVLAGEWAFQVAGDGQYRIMQDNGPTGVPTYLNGYANNIEGNPQVPILIDFNTAASVLEGFKLRANRAGITEFSQTVGSAQFNTPFNSNVENFRISTRNGEEIREDLPPEVEFEAVEDTEVAQASPRQIKAGQMFERQRRLEQRQVLELGQDLARDDRVQQNVELKQQRQSKADRLPDMFNNADYRAATPEQRETYQGYLMQWLRDDNAIDVLSFNDWMETQ